MTRARWRATLGVTAAGVLLAACGGGSSPGSGSDTSPVATGVTGPDGVTGPTTAAGATAPATSAGAAPDPSIGSGAPRGFPDDFPRPDDAEPVVGSATIVGEDRVLSLELAASDDLARVVAFFRRAIDDAEFAVLLDQADGPNRTGSANLRFATDDYVGDVLITATPGGTSIVLTATLPAV